MQLFSGVPNFMSIGSYAQNMVATKGVQYEPTGIANLWLVWALL